MTIDILSDLHLDFYFLTENLVDVELVRSIFDPIFLVNQREVGDVLVIAGDIGHYNHQNIQVLKIFQTLYYKHIVCVLGNHDYYLIDYSVQKEYHKNSFNRVEEMREMINKERNIYCLNGDVVEIDGVRFGGCDSSYNDAYLKKYFYGSFFINKNKVWKNNINDYHYIYNLKHYDTLYKLELPKIKAVYKKCDIMVTHVNPSYLHKHLPLTYKNNQSNMFFTFDGHKFMKDGVMKYWIFGHTHTVLEYEYNGVKSICNPLGYPNEHKPSIKSINFTRE